MKFAIGLLLLLMLGQISASPVAMAESKLGGTTQRLEKKLSISSLTAADCGLAGGKVGSEATNICPSGQACFTTGLDKKSHEVCLAKSSK